MAQVLFILYFFLEKDPYLNAVENVTGSIEKP